MPTPFFRLRQATPSDRDAAYAVCLQTGDSGKDGTALHPEDPDALGNLYVGPYLVFEPDLSFVLEDAQGVCGYVLAAFDSAAFYRRYREEWLPAMRVRHPDPTGDPSRWTPTQHLHHEFHRPQIHFPDSFHAYPSHLHIDLIARAQGQGQGRRMMEHQLAALRAKRSPGVHLGLSAVNHRAHEFYLKLGFHELARVGEPVPEVIYMGLLLP